MSWRPADGDCVTSTVRAGAKEGVGVLMAIWGREMDEVSVPVTVDAVVDAVGFSFARCTYFTIECEIPSPGWTLGLEERQIPFLMTGLSGIIFRPSLDEPLFTGHGLIERLFEDIEADNRLSIGTADIWVPSGPLAHFRENRPLNLRGVTFRTGKALFLAAMAFRNDTLSREHFERSIHEMEHEVTFSPEEDKAFAKWRGIQVELARRDYPKDRELALQRKPRPERSDREEGLTR